MPKEIRKTFYIRTEELPMSDYHLSKIALAFEEIFDLTFSKMKRKNKVIYYEHKGDNIESIDWALFVFKDKKRNK